MKPRLKRYLKRTAIGIGVALVAFFLWSACYTLITGRRLEARLDALRKAGVPLSIADYAGKPIPPESNADVPLRRVASDLASVQKELAAIFPKDHSARGPLTPDERSKLEALFASYPRVIPGLLEAADRPGYDPGLDVSGPTTTFLNQVMTKSIAEERAAMRVLESWSTLLVAQGRRDEALAVQTSALALCRHWARQPTMIAYLTSIACVRTAAWSASRILLDGPVTEESRKALDAELARLNQLDDARQALENERAYSLSSATEMSNNIFWIRGWIRNNMMMMFIDFYEEQIQRLTTPYPDLPQVPAVGGYRSSWSPFKVLVTLLEPSMNALRKSAEQQRAAVRSLRVLNALQARGVVDDPPNLAALGLPPEALIDPITGKALIVKKKPGGWLVYSVGANGVDDGGKLDKGEDVGFGPPEPAH
ncbi:hypothetical protein [Paludisphaera rhizosphaerae]|uniref:hypothetical protein n=1 Tax=Paludisphaera rhizosphaerae TaxID=2711216 RepID=UPI0013E9CB6E|nr:hypothetical protein [Paludisphaera rhizosphaerae]